MPARIGPKRSRRIFLAKWREHRGLTQEQLAGRLDVTAMTVSRWERGETKLNTDVLSAVADALDIEPGDIYRDPDRPTQEDLLREVPPEMVEKVREYIDLLKLKRGA